MILHYVISSPLVLSIMLVQAYSGIKQKVGVRLNYFVRLDIPMPALGHRTNQTKLCLHSSLLHSGGVNNSFTYGPGEYMLYTFTFRSITSLRTAIVNTNTGSLEKEFTSYNDIFNAFRMSLLNYKLVKPIYQIIHISPFIYSY